MCLRDETNAIAYFLSISSSEGYTQKATMMLIYGAYVRLSESISDPTKATKFLYSLPLFATTHG